MERRPAPAIVLSCTTCGFIRIADDPTAARARASAHMHLSGHLGMEYSIVDSPDHLRLAQAFDQRSRKTVTGYVQDSVDNPFETMAGTEGVESAIAESNVCRHIVSPSMPSH